MNEKKSFGDKLDNFFAGKGFYIVLSLCVVIIGVSAYFLLDGRGTDVGDELTAALAPQTTQELAAPSQVIEAPTPAPPQTPSVNTDPDVEPPVDVWSEEQTDPEITANYVWPLSGEIVLPYSVTALIYNAKYGDWRTNDSINISAPLGTQVLATAAGTVKSVYQDDLLGTTVVIEHAGGLTSYYSNLASVPTVYEGDSVMMGEVIGAVGTTSPGETEDSPTLHFKMTLNDSSVNPIDYLPAR
jgi:murein DD-endopeptidase MepM/ murein hydrolase activator NlpD